MKPPEGDINKCISKFLLLFYFFDSLQPYRSLPILPSPLMLCQVLCHPELQRLSLSLLTEISDASLAAVAMNCPSLTSLSLSHCRRITDAGVAKATPYLARLQHLSLSHCENLTDRQTHTHTYTPLPLIQARTLFSHLFSSLRLLFSSAPFF